MTLKSVTYSAAFALLATTALSQTTRDDVISMLTDEGYTKIEIQRTFFGNTKFEAYGPNGEREIVLGKDGTILRDYMDDDEDRDDGNDEGYDEDDRDDDHNDRDDHDDDHDEDDDDHNDDHDDGRDDDDDHNDDHDDGRDDDDDHDDDRDDDDHDD
ncbi:MAG: hypothetical protein ACWA40_09215 [Planktomarina sp.]